MSTKFMPLELPAGVVSMPTKQMRSTNWAEVNLMRWVEGQLAPVGGQSQYNYSFASRCKAVHSWYDLNEFHYVAYLCESNLYVDIGGELVDITPVDGMVPPQPLTEAGYGDGNYSDGTYNYGEPPGVATIQPLDKIPDAWSLDNFGQILLAMTSPDGRLLQWDPGGGGTGEPDAAATRVTSDDTGTGYAPEGSLFVVTPERFVMIFGMVQDGTSGEGSFRRFGWCDQENPSSWNFSDVVSQAGFLDVEPSSPIVAAKATPLGVLFWSATTTYISQFLGIPYVYNYQEIYKNSTPWSPSSVVTTTIMTLWFSKQGMFSYNGAWVAPLNCKVRSWIDDDIDELNVREQACAVNVSPFNEFWWFFPQLGQPYNTRCAIYNYKEGWWSMGQMARSAGINGAYNVPTIMANGTVVYQHELGSMYSADATLPWAETFDLNLTSGVRLATIKQMIPDIGGDVNNLLYSLFYRFSRSVMPDPVTGEPILVAEKQTTPKRVNTSNGFLDLRTTARDFRMRIELAGPQVNPVTVGEHLIDSVARGDR
jgi:hypothetical protein